MWNIEGVEWLLANVMVRGKSVLEFGNQHVWVHAMKRCGIRWRRARDWFLDLGATEYVCIDTNGQDFAVPMDLTRALEPPYDVMLDRFELVTNVGTTEHVGKEARKQWNAFAHAVNFASVGGTIVHHLPPAGQWQDHCDVWYRDGLGAVLAQAMDVCLVRESRINLATLNPDADYLCVVLRKGSTSEPVPYDQPTPAFVEKLAYA